MVARVTFCDPASDPSVTRESSDPQAGNEMGGVVNKWKMGGVFL